MPQAMLQALLPKQCTYGRTDGRTHVYPRLSLRLAFKEVGVLSAADVTYLTRRSHTMTGKQNEKYTDEDAVSIYWIIQRRRPHWHWKGIMDALMTAASRGASLTQVMSAAEKTWNNEKAKTPAAILWEEHWTVDKPRTAGNIMGQMLCVECTPARKHPVTEMTKMGHGYVCGGHAEENK